MVESEDAFSYMETTRAYIERHGEPVAFYSDKHSVFRNARAAASDLAQPISPRQKRRLKTRDLNLEFGRENQNFPTKGIQRVL